MSQESSVQSQCVSGQVMLFYCPRKHPRGGIEIKVFLLPRNISVNEVKRKQSKTTEYIFAPRYCELVFGQHYRVEGPWEGSTTSWDSGLFDKNPNYHPSFELIMFLKSSTVPITVREKYSSKEVWSVRLNLSEQSSHIDPKTLLKSVRHDFMRSVSDAVLDKVAERLVQEWMMTSQEMDSGKVKCGADKARYVVDAAIEKGSWAASLLIQEYCELDPWSELSQRLKQHPLLLPAEDPDTEDTIYLSCLHSPRKTLGIPVVPGFSEEKPDPCHHKTKTCVEESPSILQAATKVPVPSTSKHLEDDAQPRASNRMEETEFSPDVSREDTHLSYRFSCPSSGAFRCSSTGLVFVVTKEVELLYKIVKWRVLFPLSGREPAGPLYDIECPERAVCELHLPHCEPENADLSQSQLSVVHISDSGLTLIKPERITESHVVISVSGLSLFGLVWQWPWFSSKPRAVSGKVLLFRTPRELRTSIQINVHLLISTVPSAEVENRQRVTTEVIDAPPQCQLLVDQHYCVDCDGAEVQPKRSLFQMNNDPDYSHLFQLRLPPDSSTVPITLREESSSKVVWEYKWNPHDVTAAELQRGDREKVVPVSSSRLSMSLLIESDMTVKKKLFSLRFEFIQCVSEVVLDQVLDRLLQRGVLNAAEREELASKKRHDRAGQLLDSVLNKGSKASRLFIQIFEDEDPHLLDNLLQTTES